MFGEAFNFFAAKAEIQEIESILNYLKEIEIIKH